jgi:hypothetical protein
MRPKQGYIYDTYIKNETANVACSDDGNIAYPAGSAGLRPTGCALNFHETGGAKKTCLECAGQTTIRAAHFTGRATRCTMCKEDKDTICVHTYENEKDCLNKTKKEERHTLTINAGVCQERKIVSCENAWVTVKLFADDQCEGEVLQEHTLDALKCHSAHLGTRSKSPSIKYECDPLDTVDRSTPSARLNGAWPCHAGRSVVGFISAAVAVTLLL